MKNFIRRNIGILILALAVISGATATISAQRAQRAYRVFDVQVKNLLTQLESHTDRFSNTLNKALDRSSLNGSNFEDMVNDYVEKFENATDTLKNRFDNRAEVSTEVQEVLNRSVNIDSFLRQNYLNSATNRDWKLVRSDLSTLARYYNVPWNWNTVSNNNNNNNDDYNYNNNKLNGTYRLNTSQSNNAETEINRALRNANVSSDRQERIRENALRRLESPEMLAFLRVNKTVTIASSNSRQLSFEADGRDNTEVMNNGRTMKTNARFSGEKLMIDFTGDKMNDYYLTFEPIKNANTLRVTRRLFLEGLNREVSVYSVYDRTSSVADWNIVNPSGNTNGNNNNNNNNNYNDFYVPDGTTLVGVLNNELSTNQSTEGQKFTMTVNSPSQYQGAILEGHVANLQRTGKISGRAEMTILFDQIRLRNGQTYRFAGLVQSAKSSDGDSVRISNEGEIKSDNNQTTKTVTRAGIGAVLGALIGAIAGGGQGAAIGAGIGAGAGAGSVLIQGRGDLQLNSGTEVTISATSPRSVAAN